MAYFRGQTRKLQWETNGIFSIGFWIIVENNFFFINTSLRHVLFNVIFIDERHFQFEA